VDRVINDLEAAAVRQVFTRFATGEGLKKIATALNQAGITPPRPSKSGPAGWSPSTLKAVLVRTIYNGRITWNQTKKRDKSGRKAMTKRAASEWVVVERPDLQIIDDNLWSKVSDRLAQNSAAYLRSPDGKLRGRPPGSSPNTVAYLLTGLGVCATCHGSMAVRTSFAKGQRLAYLECLTRRMKGSKICSNALVVPLKAAEEAVLRTLDAELFRPDRILRVVARVVATLTPDPTTLTAERTRLKTESLKVERELSHLTTAVAAGGDLPALLTALKDRETALAGLRTTLTQLDKREALAPARYPGAGGQAAREAGRLREPASAPSRGGALALAEGAPGQDRVHPGDRARSRVLQVGVAGLHRRAADGGTRGARSSASERGPRFPRLHRWWPQGAAIAGPFPVRLPVRGTLTLKAA
jgi:site-specific DNA recombinase